MEAITRKISPAVAWAIKENERLVFEALRKELYQKSAVWKSLMDATTESDNQS